MWACLAGMAVNARHLETAETAYAAIHEADKVFYHFVHVGVGTVVVSVAVADGDVVVVVVSVFVAAIDVVILVFLLRCSF